MESGAGKLPSELQLRGDCVHTLDCSTHAAVQDVRSPAVAIHRFLGTCTRSVLTPSTPGRVLSCLHAATAYSGASAHAVAYCILVPASVLDRTRANLMHTAQVLRGNDRLQAAMAVLTCAHSCN